MEDQTDVQLKIQELRFTRVIFGSDPSPFLLNGTFQKHFEKYEEVDPLLVKQVLDNLYVDDHLGGVVTGQKPPSSRKLPDINPLDNPHANPPNEPLRQISLMS